MRAAMALMVLLFIGVTEFSVGSWQYQLVAAATCLADSAGRLNTESLAC
jgi:hypothetical protein